MIKFKNLKKIYKNEIIFLLLNYKSDKKYKIT